MPSQRSLRSRNWAIENIPGLKAADHEQLKAHGILTTFDLLNGTQSPDRLQSLATQLQLPTRYIQKWVALADLARVPSVGCQYCGVLLHIGIISVRQLAAASPTQLQRQLLRLQVSMLNTTEKCPDAGLVSQWIAQAKLL